jgi:adenylyl-sulfate kinase
MQQEADNVSGIDEFLAQDAGKDLLRFAAIGSIDDGKSTLIGRLLHDSKNIYEDQIDAIRELSRGSDESSEIDFSLVTDGLKAEREQKITIDVAYRYFSTPRRRFIIADTPGHEQYTRNMATGTSTADLSIILIDARHGVLPQTKRHAFISSLLGVSHLLVAVNKMDMVAYEQNVYDGIREDFIEFLRKLRIADVRFVPISALKGDNVVDRSGNMPWYQGEPLLEILESVYIAGDRNLIDLRFPVQFALRPHQDFRGYCGQVASGIIRAGDEVTVLPSMQQTRIKSIVSYDGELDAAAPPMSIAVTLQDEIDVSRGDMIVHRHNSPRIERRFEAMVVWMSEQPMDPKKPYFMKHTTQLTRVRIDEVRYRVDVDTLNRIEAVPLKLNEIGRVAFTSTRPIFYDAYERNRTTGSFVLIDVMSNNTVGACMIIERQRSDRLPVHIGRGVGESQLKRRESLVAPRERTERMSQRGATIWLTGLVGSGKTEIAYALERRLFDLGATVVVLDGTNVRLGISRELDFSAEGRAEHLRRVAEVARLLNDASLLVICGFVSPKESIRTEIGSIIGSDRFLVVHVDSSLANCEARDTTGLYARARSGQADNVAGVDLPYEPPETPDLVIRADDQAVAAAVDQLLELLRTRGVFPVAG